MKPNELVLRCYVEKKNGCWQAFCVDLCLAVQGDSVDECKQKLHAQIAEYLYDAIEGEDKEYADELLNRKAPLYQVAKFNFFRFMRHYEGISRKLIDGSQAFKETMPLKLAA